MNRGKEKTHESCGLENGRRKSLILIQKVIKHVQTNHEQIIFHCL